MKKNVSLTEKGFLRIGKNLINTIKTSFLPMLLLLLVATGCKKVTEETGLVGVCPQVVSTNPANAALGVSISTSVTVTFNEIVDPATVNAVTFSLRKGATPIAGVIANAGISATFSPTMPLEPNTVYTGTVTTGVKDPARNAMVADYVWSFTTGPDPAPTVSSTDPINLAIDVAFNKKIAVTFSKAMDPTSAINSFSLANTSLGGTNVTGSVVYVGTTAVFTPTTNLLPSTSYTGTISTTAKDLLGIAMKAKYTWVFTTGKAPDIIYPLVVSTVPVNSAIGIPFNQKLTAVFSEVMNATTITTASFLVKNTTAGGTAVSGTILYSGMSAVFTPTVDLLPNTTYTGTITTAVKDMAGIALQSNYIWNFTTGNVPDAISPTVSSTDPARNGINVLLTKSISATFSEIMNATTISTGSFTLSNTTLGGTNIPGTVSYSGSTAVFVPSVNLTPNTTYTASISMAAKDLAGNALVSDYYWSFTTGSVIVLIPPTVTSTDPNNLATGVVLDKVVTATFSEAMDVSTISTSTFLLKAGTTAIAGVVTMSGNTASFKPNTNLSANTVYTGTITTGSKNSAGTALAVDYVWSFTTGILLDIIPPTVISTDPINLATGVALDKVVTATFSEAMTASTISTSTFLLKAGTTAIAGVVTMSGNVASFKPNANLTAGTVYTGTITTGSKDLAGNSLLADYVWTFTTIAAVVPPPFDMGRAAIFGAFGGNAGITNQGINTVINNGSIGTTAASTLVTGFHDGTTGDVYTETPLNVGLVTGRIHTAPPPPGSSASMTIATNGLLDATAAYNSMSPGLKPGGTDPGAGELGALTLAPGVYKAAGGSFKISNGDLTLDGKGDANASWVFQTASSLTVGVAGPTGAKSIILINGAQAKNVFWYVGSAATINGAGGGVMVGTIVSSAGVTFSTPGNAAQTVLNGRAISLNASVTMVNTTINNQ